MAATLTVNTISDGPVAAGELTLRAALAKTIDLPAEDVTIQFDNAIFGFHKTIELTQGQLHFEDPLPHAVKIVAPPAGLTISGSSVSRILSVGQGGLSIDGVTFANGIAPRPDVPSNSRGGAIDASGNLTITNCLFQNNTAALAGGAISFHDGSIVQAVNCTFTGNTVTSADGAGGAIEGEGVSPALATPVLVNCTLVGNTASHGAAIAANTTNERIFTVGNCIIQDNVATTAGEGDASGTITSLGSNIIGNVGTSTGWRVSDNINRRVTLSPLQDNGGQSLTFLPTSEADSLAIDHGDAALYPAGLLEDQRGEPRLFTMSIDIGAVEVQEHVSVIPAADQTSVTGELHVFSLGSVTSVGTSPPFQAAIDWGDGSSVLTIDGVVHTIPDSGHTYTRPGSYVVTVTATDSSGRVSNPATYISTVTGNGTATGTITPSIASVTLPAVVVPGDRGKASIVLGNSGTAKDSGTVSVLLFFSTDAKLDGGDIPLTTFSTVGKTVSIAGGKTAKTTIGFEVPFQAVSGQTYRLLAKVDAASGFANSVFVGSAVASTSSFRNVQAFGQVGTRKGVKFVGADPDGTSATISLTGPGTASYTVSGATPSIVLSGTTLASKLIITTKGGDKLFGVGNISSTSPLGAIIAPNVDLAGNLLIFADAKSIVMHDVVADPPKVISISGTTPTAFKFNSVTNATLKVGAIIKSLAVASWTDNDAIADVITSPAALVLTSKGNFDAGLNLSGSATPNFTAIKSAAIQGNIGGGATWSVNGNVAKVTVGGAVLPGFAANITGTLGAISVNGDFAGQIAATSIGIAVFKNTVTNAVVLAGANFGPDGLFAGADDTYAVGTIKSLSVTGAVTSSTLAAGVNFNTNTLIAGGKISSALFKSTLSGDSKVLAQSLPKKVKVNSTAIDPTTDPRFQLPVGV